MTMIMNDPDADIRQQVKDVFTRVKRAEGFVKDWHSNIEKWRKLYDLKHYDGRGKKGEVRYSDPTYVNTVDLSVGIMLGNELRWHAFGYAPSKKEQKDTGKIEKLVQGILEINSERSEKLMTYELFMNFNRDGGGAMYSVFDPNISPISAEVIDPKAETGMSPAWKFTEMPIVSQVIDPLSVLLLPGGPKRWLLAAIREKRSVLDVEIEFNVRIEKHQGKSEDVRSMTFGAFYNVWDFTLTSGGMKVRNTVLFDMEPVVPPTIMPGYDDLPITVNFFKPIGSESADWHNIMTPLESSVTMLERAFNRRARQIDVFSGLPLIIKSQPGRKITVDPGLYNSVNITPDEDISFPVWPGNAPDVQMHLDFLRSRVQQSGFSDVMFGSGNNAGAGFAVSQLGDQNRIRLQQPIKHLELLLTIWAKKSLKLLQQFAPGSIMCVYGKQKGTNYSDEINMDEAIGYSLRAEIRPMFPTEQQRKVAMSTQVKGTLSEYTIMERYLDIEQPEDEEDRKLTEAATRHPIALQYALIAELTKRANAGDEVARLTLQSMPQVQNASQTEGRPVDPNAPEQLTGLQSPDGQPVPQAIGGDVYGRSPVEEQEGLAAAQEGFTR
jgi:hypothetical protein